MDYENGNNKHNKTSLKRWQAQINAAFLFRLTRGLYLGPLATYDFVNVKDIKNIQILDGGPTRTSNLGAGLSLVLDKRDVMIRHSPTLRLSPAQAEFFQIQKNF